MKSQITCYRIGVLKIEFSRLLKNARIFSHENRTGHVILNACYDAELVFRNNRFLRVVDPLSSFKISYCDIFALERAYAFKIRMLGVIFDA